MEPPLMPGETLIGRLSGRNVIVAHQSNDLSPRQLRQIVNYVELAAGFSPDPQVYRVSWGLNGWYIRGEEETHTWD